MSSRKSNTINMTEGSIIKHLIIFSLPMLLGNIFQQVYNIVDSVVVGQFVGSNALAAIGATGSVVFMFIALCNGLGSGGGIIVAQRFGAGDENSVRTSLANIAYLMMGVSLILCVIAYYLTPPLLIILKTPEEILPDSIAYMRMMCIGLPLVGIYNYALFCIWRSLSYKKNLSADVF